jgi:hypothetical protein
MQTQEEQIITLAQMLCDLDREQEAFIIGFCLVKNFDLVAEAYGQLMSASL